MRAATEDMMVARDDGSDLRISFKNGDAVINGQAHYLGVLLTDKQAESVERVLRRVWTAGKRARSREILQLLGGHP